MRTLADILGVYAGSDGEATAALYFALERIGPIGYVAVNLFRAHKSSERAKKYRGGIRGQGSFRNMAYGRKSWAMDNLCKALSEHGDALGFRWGWKEDPRQEVHRWVLYVEIPGQGQVSFHSAYRGAGPDYEGEWDGVRDAGSGRICKFIAEIFQREAA